MSLSLTDLPLTAISLSIIAFSILTVALTQYFYKLKKYKVPKTPVFLYLGMLTSSIISIWSLSLINSEPALTIILVVFVALYVLPTSALLSFLLANKATPVGDIKVKTGDKLLPFKTDKFNSESLKGQRTLLKFYRGSWCPYCSAELVMFEELKPKLKEYNVQIMAISNDTVEQQKAHLLRDNISHTLISDPELNIIRQYGVEHHKAIGAESDNLISMFGIAMPLPWKMKYTPMSIPTSLLIDENGKIVWIDQSEDYRLRASEKAVIGAVTANFKKI